MDRNKSNRKSRLPLQSKLVLIFFFFGLFRYWIAECMYGPNYQDGDFFLFFKFCLFLILALYWCYFYWTVLILWTRLVLAKQKELNISCVRPDHWEFQTDIQYTRVYVSVHFDEMRQTGGLTEKIWWLDERKYGRVFWYWDVWIQIDLFTSFLVATFFSDKYD